MRAPAILSQQDAFGQKVFSEVGKSLIVPSELPKPLEGLEFSVAFRNKRGFLTGQTIPSSKVPLADLCLSFSSSGQHCGRSQFTTAGNVLQGLIGLRGHFCFVSSFSWVSLASVRGYEDFLDYRHHSKADVLPVFAPDDYSALIF